jgi:hypothetical protein
MTCNLPNAETDIHGDAWVARIRATTGAQLDELAGIASRAAGQPYTVEYAYGSPRLMARDGSVDVSPRLPRGELAQWLRAFIAGQESVIRQAPR